MIDFNYTAPELLPFRIQEVLDAPNEPHRIGGVVYVPATWQRSCYYELFGTPERAARTLHELCGGCCGLPERIRGDYVALLEWLGGDA